LTRPANYSFFVEHHAAQRIANIRHFTPAAQVEIADTEIAAPEKVQGLRQASVKIFTNIIVEFWHFNTSLPSCFSAK